MSDLTNLVRQNYFFIGWQKEDNDKKAKHAYECIRCEHVITTNRVEHFVRVHISLWEQARMEYAKKNWDWDKSYDGGGD